MSDPVAERLAQLHTQIARYEAYLQADPGNDMLWVAAGDLYHQTSDFEKAIACFEKAGQLNPDSSVPTGRIAMVRISQHRFAEAEQLLRQLVDAGDQSAELRFNLGLAVFYQERWEEARACFEDSLRSGIDAPTVYAYLSRSLHQQGDLDKAIGVCREWVERANDSRSKGYLALLHMDDRNTEEALMLAREVLAHSPDNTDAAVVVGTSALESQDMSNAVRQFEHVARLEPDNGRAHLGLGLIALYQGRHDDAIRALQRAVALMPRSAGTIVALGWAQLAHKDLAAAEHSFRQAIEVDRSFAESHGGLATVLAFQGQREAAGTEIKRANGLDPGNFGAAFATSVLAEQHGKRELATKIIGKILEQAPPGGEQALIQHLQTYFHKHPPKGSVPPLH